MIASGSWAAVKKLVTADKACEKGKAGTKALRRWVRGYRGDNAVALSRFRKQATQQRQASPAQGL